MTPSRIEKARERAEVRRELPSLLWGLTVFALIAGGVSALVLGFIPAAQRAAAPYSCPAGTVCAEAHGRTDHAQNPSRAGAGATTSWRMRLECIDADGNRQDADELRTMLALEPRSSVRGVEAVVGSTNAEIAHRYMSTLRRIGLPG